MAIVAVLLLATAATFSSSIFTANQAREITDGAIFLETAMEDLSAQPYVNLLALHGNVIYDGEHEDDSQYALELSVFQQEVDLIQIVAQLTLLQSGRGAGKVTTLRSRR